LITTRKTTGIMQFVEISLACSVGSIILGALYNWCIVAMPSVRKKRRQTRPDEAILSHLPLIGFNIASLLLISAIGLYYAEPLFSFTANHWLTILTQFALIALVDDCYFYFYHRQLHLSPFLFKHIHRIHHKAFAPYPLDFIYVHPLEWSLGAVGVALGLLVVYLLFGSIAVQAFWAYTVFRNLHELLIHSGIPSTIMNKLPYYGTNEHHDIHHEKVVGNYGSTFTFWDKLFGTEIGNSHSNHS
jgi:methylsterol monooxygenase